VERLILAGAPETIEAPKIDDSSTSGGQGEWIVTVFDNDVNTADEVVEILIAATGCDQREAEIETWEIHHLGHSVVHHAGHEECERVSAVIAQIGIRVEVSQE
jgi:ATP-dependent Clp protease adapter protein ClpS